MLHRCPLAVLEFLDMTHACAGKHKEIREAAQNCGRELVWGPDTWALSLEQSHMPQYHGLQVFNRSGPQTKCNSAQVSHLCTCIDLQCVFLANYCT